MKPHMNGSSPVRAASRLGTTISFADHPEFHPNLTPAELFTLGSFGGGYFHPIHSRVTGLDYVNEWKEFPSTWWAEMQGGPERWVAQPKYTVKMNRYRVDCGAKLSKSDTFGLDYWESKDWIVAQDPYGWVQWYCRFYMGRRSEDDERQISRWAGVAGVNGRFRSQLIGKIMAARASFDDETVSPVVRQVLQHWAYQLTEEDFVEGRAARIGKLTAAVEPAATAKTVKKRASPHSSNSPDLVPKRKPKKAKD